MFPPGTAPAALRREFWPLQKSAGPADNETGPGKIACLDGSQGKGRFVTPRMLKWYAVLAMASLCLKLPLTLYAYEYGYLRGDRTLVSPDAFAYVAHAWDHQIDIRPLGHWLYDYLNGAVYSLAPNHISVYLVMTLGNVVLSMLLPLALWLAAPVLELDTAEREPYFIGVCALTLFWPTALWLSTQDLKDTLTALLVALFVAVFVRASARSGVKFLQRLGLAGLGLIFLYLVFSVRSYLAVFLLLAAVTHLIVKERRVWSKAVVALVLVALALSPIGQALMTFSHPDKNWLLNPALAAEEGIGQGGAGVKINTTPMAMLLELPRTLINPVPTIGLTNVDDVLTVARSVFLCYTLWFFVSRLWRWRSPYKLFFILCLLLPLAFYAYIPTYSGPRQDFSSGIDLMFLFLLPLFVLRGLRDRTLGVSLVVGSVASTGGLLYTAKALF